MERIRIGISSCLLGERVRYDGGHKQDPFITEVLGKHCEWVPVCPELEVGMGVPREPVRLVGSPESARMVGTESGSDWTVRMLEWSEKRSVGLARLNLSGYILKSRSPSCGMERVKLYPDSAAAHDGSRGSARSAHPSSNRPRTAGRGLFAGVFMKHQPLMPVEEEGRLNDPGLRENFIERVFAYRRLQTLLEGRFSVGRLVKFHTAEKFLLLSHSPARYRELGRLVAAARNFPVSQVKRRYSEEFMKCLAVRPTRGKHTNVLQHIAGFLSDGLAARPGRPAREEIARLIEEYKNGLVPLIVPLTLIAHYVRLQNVEYVLGQSYLNPHPKELMLRNHT